MSFKLRILAACPGCAPLRRAGAAAITAREGWPSAGDAGRGSGVKMPFKLPIIPIILPSWKRSDSTSSESAVNFTSGCVWWQRRRYRRPRMPSEMRRVPGGPACVADIVSEQEGFETKRGGLEIADGIFARPGEIPNGFVFLLGNMNRGEISGAHRAGQLHRVTPVDFEAVAGPFRNQRRRHNSAVVPFFVRYR